MSSAERTRLLEELVQCLRSPADKAFAKTVIREVVETDGKVSPAEKQVLDEVQRALENADVGVFTRMKQLLGPSVSRRTQTASQAANREEDIEEFVRNKIFFRLKRRLESEDKKMDLDERNLEKLCLAGGLMARIAWVDQEISEAEKLAIRKNLHEKWGHLRDRSRGSGRGGRLERGQRARLLSPDKKFLRVHRAAGKGGLSRIPLLGRQCLWQDLL